MLACQERYVFTHSLFKLISVSYTHLDVYKRQRYFWPHSCLFSYICTLFKWKVPKPTPTQRVQAEKMDIDLLPVDRWAVLLY